MEIFDVFTSSSYSHEWILFELRCDLVYQILIFNFFILIVPVQINELMWRGPLQ